MAKRTSLSSFAPQAVANAGATGGTVVQETPTQSHSSKYPKVSVYLDAQEIRTLKLIGIDTGQRVSDVCAVAIREWLERNGHMRGKIYKA